MMVKENIANYIFHTTFSSDITNITDKIFNADVVWDKHTWSDNYGNLDTQKSDDDVLVSTPDNDEQEKLQAALGKYVYEYPLYVGLDQVGVTTMDGVRFNKYPSGSYMDYHVDNIRSVCHGCGSRETGVPILSAVGLLNDDFTGGEFLLCGKKIELKKNSLLVFPSNFMYPHTVTKIREGARYSFVTWMW